MPRKPIDYSNTHFYKIVCKDLDIVPMYIGHTTNFKNRKLDHKKNCLNPNSKKYNFPVYSFIRENGGWENWEMIFMEKTECNDELEALKRERELIEQNQASLNRHKPYRTQEDWDEKHKKHIEREKQKRKENPEKYKEIDKQSYIRNRDKKLQCAKNYYEREKDKVNAKRREQRLYKQQD